ncbi:unnamed protein product [Trichobilharzia szidati]|nr:unnamed protein product [Trichobilharzia szidati]
MIVILEANESFGAQWKAYAAIACLVLTMILCALLFFKFTNNVKIALILIGFIIVLWSAAICFMCCREPNFKFKPVLMIVLISLSTTFLITGSVLFYVYFSDMRYSELAGGLWNTYVVIMALVFASSLK